MYSKPKISLARIFRKNYKELIAVLLYTFFIFRLYDYRGIEALDIPMSISTVLGFAVSLLLGFRTGESYDRWWEARKIWGAIVNDSRTLTRQLMGFVDQENNMMEIQEIAYCNIAFDYALKNSLRKLDVSEEIKPFLSSEDFNEVIKQQNVPNAILLIMEQKLNRLKRSNSVTNYEFVELDKTLKRLCDHMGKCERINNTIFPVHYRYFTHVGIIVYIMMLPFGMLKSTGYFMIPIVTLIFFFFTTLEGIAFRLQDPFMNRGSDTPMSTICRTIEINVKQMLGNSDIPDKIEMTDSGAIM